MGEQSNIEWTDATVNFWGLHESRSWLRPLLAELVDRRVGGSHWGRCAMQVEGHLVDELTADQLIEEGIGLIARGLFRKGTNEGNLEDAYRSGMSAVSVIREMALNYHRISLNQKDEAAK